MCLLILLRQVPLPHQVRLHRTVGGCLELRGNPVSRMNLEASSFDAASASQVRFKDAYFGGLKEDQQRNLTHEREQISEESDDSESEPWYCKLVAQTNEACVKPLAGGTAESSLAVIQKNQQDSEGTRKNCLQLSIPTTQFTNDVFSMFWKIYGKYQDESMDDLNVHLALWRMFMYTTLQALISICKENSSTIDLQ